MKTMFEGKIREGKVPGDVAIHYMDVMPEDGGNGESILLIMGLACQLTAWPPGLVTGLVRAGYRVILFDHRDIGLSSSVDERVREATPLAYARFRMGRPLQAPYTLYDMANDTARLLDALSIDQVHVAGVSMGGMIAQILGARYPERIRTLSLVMTSDNHPANPAPHWRVLWHMNGGGIRGHDEASAVKRSLNFWHAVKSPGFPSCEVTKRQQVVQNYRRSYRPAGVLRQMRAILATGSLRHLHPQLDLPVQIIHGAEDPLVKVACGEQLARSIRDAQFRVVRGLGHDLPELFLPRMIELLIKGCQQ